MGKDKAQPGDWSPEEQSGVIPIAEATLELRDGELLEPQWVESGVPSAEEDWALRPAYERKESPVEQEQEPVSEELLEALRAADRRVFPEAAPLVHRFRPLQRSDEVSPGWTAKPEELVPDSFLSTRNFEFSVSKRFGLLDAGEEALDAESMEVSGPTSWTPYANETRQASSELTHALPEPYAANDTFLLDDLSDAEKQGDDEVPTWGSSSSTRLRALFEERRLGERRHDLECYREPSSATRTNPADGADFFRVVSSIEALALDAELRILLGPPRRATFSLLFRHGRLWRVDGPLAREVFRGLRRQELISGPLPRNEHAALQKLERAVNAGALKRFALDRNFRWVRERLIARLLTSSSLEFHLVEAMAPVTEPGIPSSRMFRAPLCAELLGAARKLWTRDWAALRGIQLESTFHLLPGAQDFLSRSLVEPEVCALLEEWEGSSLKALLDEVPEEEGVLGILLGMWVTRYVHIIEQV